MFKHIYSRDISNMLSTLRHFLLLNQLPNELFESLLIYSFDQGKIERPQAFIDSLFKQTPHDGDKTMTTLSQYLREQGFQLGEQQGIQLGEQRGEQRGSHNTKIEIATNLLNKGISIDVIKEVTGLCDNEINQLVK